LKSLAKNTAMVGGTEFMMMFVALLRNKYLAISIGAQGFGVYSLLTSFFQYANLIAGSWLSTASLKYISEYNSEDKKEEVKLLVNMTTYLVFFSATIVSIVFLVLFPVFQKAFLSKDVLFSYYAFFTAAFWGNSLANIFRVVLQSLMNIQKIVRIRIITQIANLFTVILFVYLFEMVGLFINLAIIALFIALLFFLAVKKKIKFEKFDISWYRSKIAKKLFTFSTVGLFNGFVDQTVEYLKRIFVVSFLSMASLGLFAATRSITKYLGMLTRSAMVYYKPRMSQALTSSERTKAMNDYFRLMLLIGGLGAVVTVLLSGEAIRILYTKEFLPVTWVLFVFVITQFLVNIQNGFMFLVVGMAKLRTHTFAILISAPFNILIPYFYLRYEPAFFETAFNYLNTVPIQSVSTKKDILGLLSIGVGTIISMLTRITVYQVFLKRSYGILMNKSNIFLSCWALFLLFGANFGLVLPFYFRLSLVFIVVGLYYMLLNKNEKEWAYNIIKVKILRKK
jgi:PST family polysaccharide transporter